jgi:hypothetical protein
MAEDQKQYRSEGEEGGKTMESRNNNIQTEKRKFRLYEHPWLSLLAVMLTTVLSSILTGIVVYVLIGLPYDSPTAQFAATISYHILTIFLFAFCVSQRGKGRSGNIWTTSG